MKQKIVFEDDEKRTLVYRYQRSGDERPLLMRWNQEFEKWSVALPNSGIGLINEVIRKQAGEKYCRPVSAEYSTTYVSVNIYNEELKGRLPASFLASATDVVLKANYFNRMGKQGYTFQLLDGRFRELRRDWLAGDDYFDDPDGVPEEKYSAGAAEETENSDELPF